jgi:hypothetical protein
MTKHVLGGRNHLEGRKSCPPNKRPPLIAGATPVEGSEYDPSGGLLAMSAMSFGRPLMAVR